MAISQAPRPIPDESDRASGSAPGRARDASRGREDGPEPAGLYARTTEQRLAQIFDAAAVGMAVAAADGRFIDVNPAAQTLFGRSLEELRGLTFRDVTHPDDLAATDRQVAGLEAKGGSYTLEKRYRRPDGSEVWARVTVSMLTGDDGHPYMLAIVEDISAARAAEHRTRELNAELERRERRYRTLVENVPGVIYRASADEPFELQFVGEPAQELLGYTADTLLEGQLSALHFIHEDDVVALIETLDERRAAVDHPFEIEYRIRHADGSMRWVLDKSRCVEDEHDGRVFDGVLFDITAQKVAEEQLRTRELEARETAREQEHVRQLQALARAAVDINSPLHVDEMLQRITEAARDIVGAHMSVTSTTVEGTGRAEGWPQTNISVSLSDKYAAYRNYAVPSLGAATYGLVCENNDVVRFTQEQLYSHPAFANFGAERDRHPPLPGWLAAPLVARDGSNLGMIQLSDAYDGEFTERDEAILVQLAQMASTAIDKARLLDVNARQAAQRFREELLSGISHDMQTPLAAIVGLAELLIDDPSADPHERLDSYLALHRQASGLRTLVQQFLDYSRLQADRRLSLRIRPMPVATTIERAVAMFSHLRAFEVEVPAQLPEILADDHRVEQVLANLLSNAIKFSTEPVAVAVSADDECVVIDVTDRGIGMDAQDLSRLFEKFHRGASSAGVRGTGIGLYISHAVAEAQGGTLTARSEPGVGSTFTVRLPRADRRGRE